jgi:hypothetical protein
MRCPRCGGYSWDSNDYCLGCGYHAVDTEAPSWWGSQDWKNPLKSPKKNEESLSSIPTPSLEICPHCHRKSLFYIEKYMLYECLNLECKAIITHDEIVNSNHGFSGEIREEDRFVNQNSELSNPLLLTVKMFLADIRSWRRRYKEDEYVCADFAREVYDAATDRGIRCGYVVIGFEKSEIGHAVIAFETDYGLVYFEPQNGETIDIALQKTYAVTIEGVPENDIIRLIEISWNDGTSTKLE